MSAAAVVAMIALLGSVWLYRARSTRRWKAALDAYAEREVARQRRHSAPPTTASSTARNTRP